ncbi:hypothetical protein MYX07_02710 [Patescibacteria group bacterium AH-259-L07]|nr:hypothetical protein [Patescibacteria group bacterium AH-259-L07]
MEYIMELGSSMTGALAALIVSLAVLYLVHIFLKGLETADTSVKEVSKKSKIEVFNRRKWRSAERCSMRGSQVIVHIDGQPDQVFHKRSLNKVRPVQ